MDDDLAFGEKPWQQLLKNARSCIEQILEATTQKTAAVQPASTHLKKLSKLDVQDMQDTAVKIRTNHKRCYLHGPLHTDMQVLGDLLEPIYNMLCTDTGGSLEDLPGAMDNKDKCWERVREIRARGIWWWWWWWWFNQTEEWKVMLMKRLECLMEVIIVIDSFLILLHELETYCQSRF